MVIALATSPPAPSAPATLGSLLARFAAPSQDLLRKRELLRRIDSKYVIRAVQLPQILAELDSGYAALRVPGGCVATYRSLYFDTPELVCFHDHRRGRRLRYKVRIRHYPEREVSYLEVKAKQTEVLTHKHRMTLPFGSEELGADALEFLRGHIGATADRLRPELRVHYKRIGLLALHSAERVTIDLELEFIAMTGEVVAVGDAGVLEVKQPSTSRSSPISRALSAVGVRAQSLSKYTTAIALIRPETRHNRLRLNLRALGRTIR